MENRVRRRIQRLDVAQRAAVVTHLKVLKERFQMAKECVKSLMSAKDSYKNLTKKRREFWKKLLTFSSDVRSFNKNLSARFPSKKPRSWHKARRGFKKGIKLMESVTELYKTYYATTNHFQTALERFEQVSERFWESEDTLSNFHDRLGTMNPDEILAVQLPDFLWIHNNLYPDHKELWSEWQNLNLIGIVKNLQLELNDLKSMDFNSSSDDESETSSDCDLVHSPESMEDLDNDDDCPGHSSSSQKQDTETHTGTSDVASSSSSSSFMGAQEEDPNSDSEDL